MKNKGIMFWENAQSGNLLSHHNGLTEELVNELKNIQPGDRLILWKNKKKSDNYPEITLKVFKKNADK